MQYATNLCKVFQKICITFSSSTIWLAAFFTNRASYKYTCKPLAGISDHKIVYVTSAVDIEHQQPVSREIYLWNKADFDHINSLERNLKHTDEFLTKHNSVLSVISIYYSNQTMCNEHTYNTAVLKNYT